MLTSLTYIFLMCIFMSIFLLHITCCAHFFSKLHILTVRLKFCKSFQFMLEHFVNGFSVTFYFLHKFVFNSPSGTVSGPVSFGHFSQFLQRVQYGAVKLERFVRVRKTG